MSKIELLPCPLCGVEYEQKPSAYPLHEPYAEHPREGSPLDGHCIMSGHMFALLPSLVASWNTRSPQPAGVRVKGLEWKDGRPDTMQGETKRWEAHTITGWFTAYECYGKFWYETPTHKDFNARPAASMDEAIAAAEADYRQRILSALETQEEEPWGYHNAMGQVFRSDELALQDEHVRSRFTEPLYTHPTPVQKEGEGQTVSDEPTRLIAMIKPDNIAEMRRVGDLHGWCDRLRSALTAALVKP